MGKVRTITGALGNRHGTWVSYEDYQKLEAQLKQSERAKDVYIHDHDKVIDQLEGLENQLETAIAAAEMIKRGRDFITIQKSELEAQLADIERELIARNTMLPDSRVIKNIIAILDRPIRAAIGEVSDGHS